MKKKLLLLAIGLFLLTGCTQKWLKDDDNKIIRNDSETLCNICINECSDLEESQELCLAECEIKCEEYKKVANGQTLREDILCKPKNKEVLKIYESKNIDIESLPECNNFKLKEGKYEGLWASVFVKPLAWLLLTLGTLLNNYGLSLVLISLLIRFVMMPFTKSTADQSDKMKKAQPEINAIDLKYKDKTDQESTINKSQETLAVYKKYKINPLSSCLFALIQIPILFAFIDAINRIPAIFEGKFLGLHLGITPANALSKGEWWYLLIVIILAVVTYFSIMQNKAPEQPGTKNQMKIMNIVLIGMITVTSFTLATAIGVYWITSSSFTILQNVLLKKGVNK